ncbi:MAG: transposase [Proteobacteria bacterium]|nr:transposase [Pseudomonadota bacterium]
MTHDALRRGRVSLPGQVYVITTVTDGRCPYFRDFGLARAVVAEMRRMHDAGWVESMAWVLMPDHLHWLFQLQEARPLGEVVKAFKARSALAVNRRLGRQGAVWQKAFHDRAIRREEDLPAIARYIVANPLRAQLVPRVADYPHWDAIWL